MELSGVKCPNCGAPIKYTVGMHHIKCESCDSEFVMKEDESIMQIPYMGGIVYTAHIPEGFSANVFEDNNNISKDALKCICLKASSGNADLFFYPRAYYKNAGNGKHFIDGMTLLNFYKYRPMEEYVPARIGEIFPQARNIGVNRLDDGVLPQKVNNFMYEAGQIIKNAACECGRYEISFDMNGQRIHGLFGTILVCRKTEDGNPPKEEAGEQINEQAAAAQEEKKAEKKPMKMDMSFFLKGGLVGAMLRGEENVPDLSSGFDKVKGFFKNVSVGSNWGKAFDMIIVTPEEDLRVYSDIFDNFLLNINYGPGYAALEQQERAAVESIMMQGAMQRQQNQFAAQNRLSQSIAQRNDIIMSGYEQRTAMKNHMMDMYSEANRGVNSYTNSYGQKVEASVRYDHVYQDGTDYIASDGNLNLGPNWTELKKNQ